MTESKWTSRKFLLTAFALLLCAVWMFGGETVRGAMSGAPEQLKGFLGWLGDMTPLVMAIILWSYNVGQGQVDAAKETAKGTVEATKIAAASKEYRV